jgi:ubiquinone/menaquinone biosynthesis C-methylase UbiE
MSDDATGFVGSIPENYDRGLGPIIFTDYDEHTARLVAGYAPSRVLETGAGTGIVTRRLRDLLPATTRLIATDLNPPMLDVARKKFRPDEPVEFGRMLFAIGSTFSCSQAQRDNTGSGTAVPPGF